MSSNQLQNETSPYLLQHKDNPVHWWPWGEDALEAAKSQNKPILISIGYAACHWCHVMAHESFEDEATAQIMNNKFINIKVDREERPDIDHIYMSALHHLGEQGGWPLTMFLTPEAKPYWGGTYFPPEPGFGRPSFKQALEFAEKVYIDDNETVTQNSESLTQLIAPEAPKMMGPDISDNILKNITQRLGDMMDGKNGGLRGAPKFPQYPIFNFLWRNGLRQNDERAKNAVIALLNAIFQGGIYDHLGGGLSRYSVDERWLVPHFEKMLYDNALMMELAVNVYKETKNPLLKIRIEEITTWLEREMLTDEGAFSASLDADSEGVEGKFYVWTEKEIKSLLGSDYEFFASHYDVTSEGNWEQTTILNRLNSPQLLSDEEEQRLKSNRETLLEARSKRIRPGLDDKILADWNGMMITALSLAGQCFENQKWLQGAKTAYTFIKQTMDTDKGLHHSYRLGKLSSPPTSNDYAQMIRAALTLYNITAEQSYLEDADKWTGKLNEEFWCEDHGGYFITGKTRSDVIIRGKTGADEAIPNANAIMVSNLMTLYLLTGKEDMRKKAKNIVQCFGDAIAKNIFSHIGLLAGAIDIISPLHLVIVKPETTDDTTTPMLAMLKSLPAPGLVVQIIKENLTLPETSPAYNKKCVEGKTTAYLCVGETCQPPITKAEDLSTAIKNAVTATL